MIYVDDILITGDDLQGIKDLKKMLEDSFQTKALGLATYFLGLEISKTPYGYFVWQPKFAKDLVDMVGLTDDKHKNTPMESNLKYGKLDGDPILNPTLYRKVVGT